MKAAFLTGVCQFEVREVPVPAVPDDGLLLRVQTCGVCGSDLRRWREGPYPGAEDLVPGHEIGGVVEAVGSRLRGYRVGDRLAVAPDVHCGECYYCQRGMYNLCDRLRSIGIHPGYSGGFTEKMVLTGEMLTNGVIHPMPDGISFAQASLAEPMSSVIASHAKAGTSLSEVVLVLGAGPIGCLHIVIAKLRGARVILSEPSAVRREMAREFAPDLVIDPSQEDVVGRVREWTGGLGADIVVCANPVAATQAQAVQAVRKAGRVMLFGGLPKANPQTTLDSNRIHYGEIVVVGAFSYHPTDHEKALRLLSQGVIPADRLITHTLPLEQINEAFQAASNGQALKVIVQS